MKNYQQLLERALTDAPYWVLRPLFEAKLRAGGIEPDSVMVDRLMEHIRQSPAKAFNWNNGQLDTINSHIDLTFDEADMADVEQQFTILLEKMPDIVANVASEIASTLLDIWRDNWAKEWAQLVGERDSFNRRIALRWGKPLDLLRLMLRLSLDLGQEIAEARAVHQSELHDVQTRLHVRACQVTAEVLTLLENGFADGAMARWRTLHEICIVMLLMCEHGAPIAERYLEHGHVEAMAGKEQYIICNDALGFPSFSKAEYHAIDVEYERVIARYGKAFQAPYGWAAGFVPPGKRGRVGLGELEQAAGRGALASHYRMASQNVHAGPNALYYRLGLLGEPGLLAGASDSGLTEPGQNTAMTFGLISILLIQDDVTMDHVIVMNALKLLREEIPIAFLRAEKQATPKPARSRLVKRYFGMNKRERRPQR